MTPLELRAHLYKTFASPRAWPARYSVDSDTYDQVATLLVERSIEEGNGGVILAGPHGGMLFKGIELFQLGEDGTDGTDGTRTVDGR